MINPNDPAFPNTDWDQNDTGKVVPVATHPGMSMRAELAARCLQGLLANPVHSQKWTFTFLQRIKHAMGLKASVRSSVGNAAIKIALSHADALILELNQLQP